MSDLWQDVTYALRKLRAAPAFTITAVVTLALGVGANTAVFSVVNSVLLQPLNFDRSQELMRVRFAQDGRRDAAAPADLADFRANAKRFDDFAFVEGATFSVVRDDVDPVRVTGARVSANWFDLLRVRPLYGRFFRDNEDDEPYTPVAVMSEGLWRRRFGGDSAVVGKTIRINSRSFRLIGIVPEGKSYPLAAELWAPLGFTRSQLSDEARKTRWLAMVARIKPGVDPREASGELDAISRIMERRFPDAYRNRRARSVELREFTVGDVRKPLLVLMSAVALVLLIACANVANLMLVRATARQNEIAIRTALGASRMRLIRQALTESLLLSTLGAAAGLVLAVWGTHALLALAPGDLPRAADTRIDGMALAMTGLVALLTGIVFGVLPATQVAGGNLEPALRAGGRGAQGTGAASRTKRVIVAAEVALAVVLLTGSGLLLRSFNRLVSVDTGFAPEHVQTMMVVLPGRTYDTMPKVRNFAAALEQRLRSLPGVRAAALASSVPLDGNDMVRTFTIVGRPEPRPTDLPAAQVVQVTPDYFEALGIPVMRGRGLSDDDRRGSSQVVVVNQSFVKRHLAAEDALGKQVRLDWRVDGERQGGQIVGVVGDVRGLGLEREAEPTIYLPMAQSAAADLALVVRTAVNPASMTSSVRGAVRELDRELPVFDVKTMEERVADYVGPQRFYATLVGAFAIIALTLAGVGLYGVIAYAVSQRNHELGVRIALGATAGRISRMVLAEGLIVATIGLAIGLAASLAAARLLASLLYEVGATDPVAFLGSAAVLGIVTTLASYLPARRAARVDPLIAMRD